MSRRRRPRAWIGERQPIDPAELAGPRGLIQEVIDGAAEDRAPEGDEAFFWALLTEARRQRILSVVEARLASVTVVLDRLIDPHNTAAILRTAEGMGIARVHVVPHPAADALMHRRVTQDAEKWLDVEVHADGAACARSLAAKGFTVLAGHLDAGARLYTDIPGDVPVALVFGSEHEGPGRETLAACHGTFRIPMAGFTQSLNVSVAAGIALSHTVRARRRHLGAAGDLSAEERAGLRRRFTLLAAALARRLKHPPAAPSKEET